MDVDKLEQLGRLRDSGVLTPQEFNLAKSRLLSEPETIAVSEHRDSAGNEPQRFSGASDFQPPTHIPLDSSRGQKIDDVEIDIDVFQGSTIGWLLGSFAGWLTLLLCIAPLLLAATLSDSSGRAICFLASGVGILRILLKWLEHVSSKYELTSQRLIIKRGIIFKNIDEIELYRVKDVRVDFSLLNQLAGIGRILVRSSDNNLAPELRDIPQAREIRETLRGLVAQERQRRRVFEGDRWEA